MFSIFLQICIYFLLFVNDKPALGYSVAAQGYLKKKKKKEILKKFGLGAKWGDVMSDIVSAKDQQLALITSPARRLSGASVPAGLQSGAERCCGLAGKAAVGLGCGQIKRRENGGFLLSKKISQGGVRWQSNCLGGGKKKRGGQEEN